MEERTKEDYDDGEGSNRQSKYQRSLPKNDNDDENNDDRHSSPKEEEVCEGVVAVKRNRTSDCYDIVKERVRDILREEKIKLWASPYVSTIETTGGTTPTPSTTQLRQLTSRLCNSNDDDMKIGDDTDTTSDIPKRLFEGVSSEYDEDTKKDMVYHALLEWQERALSKLQEKKQKGATIKPSSPSSTTIRNHVSSSWSPSSTLLTPPRKSSDTKVLPSFELTLELTLLMSNATKLSSSTRITEEFQTVPNNVSLFGCGGCKAITWKQQTSSNGKLVVILRLEGISSKVKCSELTNAISNIVSSSSSCSLSNEETGTASSSSAIATATTTTDQSQPPMVKKKEESFQVRALIYRGRNLLTGNMDKELGSVVMLQKNSGANNNAASSVTRIICLMAPSNVSSGRAAAAAASGSNITSLTFTASDDDSSSNNIQSRIDAVRRAAHHLSNHALMRNIEITDQHGNMVGGMTKDDKLGFLTSLALHRLATIPSVDASTTDIRTNGTSEARTASSSFALTSNEDRLVLLLEADREWNSHTNLNTFWKHKVDNYGLLQLDIAWSYLKCEALDCLEDAIERLHVAERVLKQQVHTNFVTLALTQAELGNAGAVPPLAAVFAKLFLLQGIANLHGSSATTSTIGNNTDNSSSIQQRRQKDAARQYLDQAYMLLQSLRSMSPEDSVEQLLNVMNANDSSSSSSSLYYVVLRRRQPKYTKTDAIAALRKSQGNVDAAADLMSSRRTEVLTHERDRQKQRNYGLCVNEKDYVNMKQLNLFRPMLQTGQPRNANRHDDKVSKYLAVALLRLTNNNIPDALDLKQRHTFQKIMDMEHALDELLTKKGLMRRRDLVHHQARRRSVLLIIQRQRQEERNGTTLVQVDEMALVTLMSMGVDDIVKAKRALQNNQNNVESAIIWLSSMDDDRISTGNEEEVASKNTTGATPPTTNATSGTPMLKDDRHNDSDSSLALSDDDDDDHDEKEEGKQVEETEEQKQRRLLEQQALYYLQRELGTLFQQAEGSSGGGTTSDLEQEYLGKSLDEEWDLCVKYRSLL